MNGTSAAHARQQPTALHRQPSGPAVLSAGFRPFFLLAAVWSAIAIPLWLALFTGSGTVPTALTASVWHGHEMVFGYALAAIAGFLLTAIPNWTGRLPLRGMPLAVLALIWLVGRVATLASGIVDERAAAAIDLAFPLVFLVVVAREIVAGRNWRNLPMLAALMLLLAGNALVHADALGIAGTAELGLRLGIGTLVMLIALVGGRIIPSFTGNWLAKERPQVARPAPADRLDFAALLLTGVAIVIWVADPGSRTGGWLAVAAGLALAARLARWRGAHTMSEPLLWVLHLGYAWLAVGVALLGANAIAPLVPPSTALHAITVGAVGTMTLAVMTRATLGHTGAALTAGTASTAMYLLVTMAALIRLLAPLAGNRYGLAMAVSGGCWTAAFVLFIGLYGPRLVRRPRGTTGDL